jgi:hypothetical protein
MCTKNVRAKGGIITISVTEKFFEDVEAFNRLFQGESDRCLVESRQAGGRKVDCRESSVKLMQEFERIFGEGACRKVFGEGYVSFQAFAEFFDKLEPMIRRWAEE